MRTSNTTMPINIIEMLNLPTKDNKGDIMFPEFQIQYLS
jgi:hypothetical protein